MYNQFMKKQPKSLYIFFFTEMWERYGFYTILTLLIFYLIHFFHLTDKLSYGILGSITALAYGNSVLGGYIADRLIGHRTTVFIALILLSLGYSLITISNNLITALGSFSIITVGTGLLKPNISSMVGFLYNKQDTRRHSGYTIFFVGINIGIILGETAASLIQQYFGWHSVFFSASIALLIALATFWFGTRHFNIRDNSIIRKSIKKCIIAVILVIIAILVSYYVIAHQEIAMVSFGIIAIVCISIVLYEISKATDLSRRKLLTFLILMGISTFYWALYFQMFFSMNLFIERVVDRHLWNITLIPSIYPAIETTGVIFIGLLLAWLWRHLETTHSRLNPSIPMKFTLAMGVHSLALGLLYFASLRIGKNSLVMPGWLIFPYILIALGELLISPIGLAMIGELVPRRLVGLMMGIFFITQGLGGKLSGILADIATVQYSVLNDLPAIEQIYQHSFLIYFTLSLIATTISFGLVPILKKLTTQSNSQVKTEELSYEDH